MEEIAFGLTLFHFGAKKERSDACKTELGRHKRVWQQQGKLVCAQRCGSGNQKINMNLRTPNFDVQMLLLCPTAKNGSILGGNSTAYDCGRL